MPLIPSIDPLLHRPSAQATEKQLEEKAELRVIASSLIHEMDHHSAHGLSACQVGMDIAMFVMNADARVKVCINPMIVAASSSMSKEYEGCLSYPGLSLNVSRPDAVVVRYHDIDGNEVTEHLDGFAARVWLHEYDHTMGICFVDRVSKLSLDMAKRKLAKLKKRITR